MGGNILGLDIQHHAVSAVLLKSGFRGNRVEAFARSSSAGPDDLQNSIGNCLEAINQTADISGSTCIASLPADQIFFRNIKVPFRENKKIRQILPYEIEPTLPFPADNFIIDFFESDINEATDLVVAAIEKSKLESYLNLILSFQVEPKALTAGGCPTAHCLSYLPGLPQNYLYLDIGQTTATLCSVTSGRIRYIRSFLLRSNDLSETTSLCTEIQRTFHAFSEILPDCKNPEIVFLTGSGLEKTPVEENIKQTLDIPVEIVDLARIAGFTTKNISEQKWLPHLMDNAFALTLIEIEGIDVLNFRKGPFAIRKHWETYRKEILRTGILSGIVLALIFMNIILDSYLTKQKVDNLDAHITEIFKTTFPEVKKIVDPLQQMQIKLKEARKQLIYPTDGEPRIRRIDILNDISRLITKDTNVDITRLVMGPETVSISGNTDTFNSVNIIKKRLERGDSFKKVTISSANIDKSGSRVRFKLNIQPSHAVVKKRKTTG